MSKAAPSFPFYAERWLVGTAHLSPAARGIYIDLLAWAWANNRPVPADEAARCRIARCLSLDEFRSAWAEMADKWHPVDGGYANGMLEQVREAKAAFSKTQRAKAKAKWGRVDTERIKRHQSGIASGIDSADAHDMPSYFLSPIEDQDQDPGAHAPDAVVFWYPTKDGKNWPLSTSQIERWQTAYHNLNVEAECGKALAWCEANRSKRKKAAGMQRFLVGWLNREKPDAPVSGTLVPKVGTPEYYEAARRLREEAP